MESTAVKTLKNPKFPVSWIPPINAMLQHAAMSRGVPLMKYRNGTTISLTNMKISDGG